MPTPDEPTVAPPTVTHVPPATDAPETVVPTGVAPPIDPPFPPTIAGYVIEGRLGKGGMGVVYKARQPGLDRIVALKMILNADHAGHDERRRFLHEAKSLAELRHPNIVQVYEVGENDGNPFISLEYVDGGSLDTHLAGTPLPPRDAAILVENGRAGRCLCTRCDPLRMENGRRPFRTAAALDTVLQVISEEPVSPSTDDGAGVAEWDLPIDLAAVLLR